MKAAEKLRSAAADQGHNDVRIGHPRRQEHSVFSQAIGRAQIPGGTDRHGLVSRKRRQSVLSTLSAQEKRQVLEAYARAFNAGR